MRPLVDGIRQTALLAYGLDILDAILIRTTIDMISARVLPAKKISNEEYFMPSYAAITSYLPCMKMTRADMYNRFLVMCNVGIMKSHTEQVSGKTKMWFFIPSEVVWAFLNNEETFSAPKIKNNDPSISERNEIKDRFYNLYRLKSLEIRGTDKLEGGSIVKPAWGAKQAKLLSTDFSSYTKQELMMSMATFFSDIVEEVANFTRYKQKAGYGYEIFHSQLGKLAMGKRPHSELPCSECGFWKGHAPSCTIVVKEHAERQTKIINVVETRQEVLDSLGGKSFTDVFNEIRRKADGDQ